MGYKVFFAFQMDTEDKFGKGFIQSAVEIAIQQLKDEGLEVTLDYGFRGTPGTPPLLDEMLKKSDESDMVIVDLTYTSAKEWLNAKEIGGDDTSKWISIEKDADRKPSPNPNVLLETGYAWAKKGTYRTLAIMNEAFGSPKLLPVDLKGFRWGITYNLDKTNYHSRKQKRKKLAEALFDSIKNSILSEAIHQSEKWKPIKLIEVDWFPSDFRSNFISTESSIKQITHLRANLVKLDNPQRITGPKNSGKSRLAFEVFRKTTADLPRHELINNTWYFDLNNNHYDTTIEGKLQDLKNENQNKILILDNCPLKTHEKVLTEYLNNTNVRLLSIHESVDKFSTININSKDVEETIKSIGNKSGNSQKINSVLADSKLNLRAAINLFRAIPDSDTSISKEYETKWSQILGDEKHALKIIETLSLFSRIGFTKEYEIEALQVMKLADITSRPEFDSIIDSLIEKGIIKQVGDYILLEIFEDEIIEKALQKIESIGFELFLKSISQNNLSSAFSSKIIDLYKKEIDISKLNPIFNKEGIFYNYDFITSRGGSSMVMEFAELKPNEILDGLEKVFENKQTVDLKSLLNGRRNLVWALEKLVYRSELFEKAAEILFKLALAENENISNNATGQFVQLYQVLLSGTEATLEQRIKLLHDLMEKYPEEIKSKVFLSALNRGLNVRNFSRSGSSEKQVDKEFIDYQPDNGNEILGYYKAIIDLLVQLEEFEIILNQFSSQYLQGNKDEIFKAIKIYLEKKGTLNLELRQQFEYVLREVNEGSKESEEIKALIEQFSAKDLSGQLKEKVILAPYSNQKDKDGNWVDVSANRAKDYAKEIGKEDDWLNYLSSLLKGEQRFTFSFGEGVAKVRSNDLELVKDAIQELEKIDKKEQNVIFFNGYLNQTKDDDFVRKVIDLFLAKESIAFYAIRFNLFINYTLEDLKKLYSFIEKHPESADALTFIKKNSLKWVDFKEFIDWLKTVPGYGIWKAIDLCHGQFDRSAELNKEQKSLLEDLLFKKNMLVDFDHHSQFSLFQLVDLVRLYSKDELTKTEVDFLTKEVIKATEKIEFGDRNYLGELLSILFEEDFKTSWSLLAMAILSMEFKEWWNLKDVLSKYQNFDDEILLESMEKYPEKLPQKVIEFVRFDKVTESDSPEWSDLVLTMIKRYHSNEIFLDYLSSRLHSFTISGFGAALQLLKVRRKLVEKLLAYDVGEIKKFAQEQIQYFDRAIEREKRSDENDTLLFNR